MDKQFLYERIVIQLDKLLENVENPISKMATINTLLYHKMPGFYWVGNYMLYPENKLLVGPYQGTLACLELKQNTGVCWAAINSGKTIIVPDVHQFEGHIACDPKSKSEIVVPILSKTRGPVIGVIDIDSTEINHFDEIDQVWLEKIAALI
jgi:L-methionine (R)-S-oxide reductase